MGPSQGPRLAAFHGRDNRLPPARGDIVKVRLAGFEPATPAFVGQCSESAELQAHLRGFGCQRTKKGDPFAGRPRGEAWSYERMRSGVDQPPYEGVFQG